VKEKINTDLLVKQIAQDGNRDAFGQLYELYFSKCYEFAVYLTKSKVLAEEVVMDVFLNLWQNRHVLLNIRNINAYILFAVRNRALYYLRSERGNRKESLDMVIQTQDEAHSPEEISQQNELKKIVNEAVKKLPERCRLVYYMVREEGLSYADVAEVLDISERTVNSQMTLAVKKIAEYLKRFYGQSR